MLHNRQPQTGAAGGFAAAGVGAVEAFGQARNMLRFNPHAIVLHRKHPAIVVRNLPAEHNMAAVRGVFAGVKRQVGKGAAQLARVTQNLQWRAGLQFHLLVFAGCQRPGITQNLLQQFVQIQPLWRFLSGCFQP